MKKNEKSEIYREIRKYLGYNDRSTENRQLITDNQSATQRDCFIFSSHLTSPNRHIRSFSPVNSVSFLFSETDLWVSEKKLYLNRPRGPKLICN